MNVSAVAVPAAVYATMRVTSFAASVLLSRAIPAPFRVWSTGAPCATIIDAVSASSMLSPASLATV